MSRSYVDTNQADDLFPFAGNGVAAGAGNILAASGTLGGNPIPVAGNRLTGRLAWTGTPTGTFTIQTSFDASTWAAFSTATFTAQPAGSASSCTFEAVNLNARFFRVLYTATSGTGTVLGRATQHLLAAAGSSTSAPAQESQIVPTVGSSNAWSIAMSTALATKLIIKASAGNLRCVSGRVDSTLATGTYYLHLWNLTDIPANATAVSTSNSLMAPQKIQHVTGTDSKFVWDFPDSVYGSAGITLGISTTEFTQTVGTAVVSATAEYK